MENLGYLLGVILIVVIFFAFIVSLFNRFLKKAQSGQALVKTGFGLKQPGISLSSAFIIPLLHKVETIDLTVKTVRIDRRGHDSLSCADGIRAEVEVDFYIQINTMDNDIRRVAMTIGCVRASNITTLRELFEAKFADALKTAGSKLTFDQLYQNRSLFRDEVLKALGQAGEGDLVLNGYKLDDVAIQYLEQLPLDKHNPDNVLDAKGRKVIAERTSSEAEFANERLRQREITIQEQNQKARIRDLQIRQDISEKEATQAREVKEIQSRESTKADTTLAEQERLSTEAMIARDRSIKIAEEQKQQEVLAAQIARERAIQVAEQEKQREIEIAKINREIAQAEATKARIKQQEEVAKQDALRIKAEEQTNTVKAMEIANRNKQIEIIQAEKEAAVEIQRQQVAPNVRAYEITTVAKAKLEAADLEVQAAEKQAKALIEVGTAEAQARRLKLEAENVISPNSIMANALMALIPLLPAIIEKLMLPAEKIESIKVLNIEGMQGMLTQGGGEGGTQLQGGPASSIMNTVVSMGMVMPLLKEIGQMISGNADLKKSLQELPGGDRVLDYLDQQKDGGKA